MVYILTSSGNVLSVKVRPQKPRINDPVSSAILKRTLLNIMAKETFDEQQEYLDSAALASYISLNKSDQQKRFRASVYYTGEHNLQLNFTKGSSSSGLGMALGLFNTYWTTVLNKGSGYDKPVFATGEIRKNGEINKIGYIDSKLISILAFVKDKNITNFYVCIPKKNKEDLSKKTLEDIRNNGGQIIAKDTIQEMLLSLLGEQYDGGGLGRWEPFKGFESFEYEDSIRFFGRTNDVQRLYEDLNSNGNILIVTGITGSGKSSLIKAGLIPYLKSKNQCDVWLSITPTKIINKSLLIQVTEFLTRGESNHNEICDIVQSIRSEDYPRLLKYFRKLNILNYSYFIHIDQFEEVFTNQDLSETLSDIRNIIEILKFCSDISLVVTIRNEYIHRLLDLGLIESPVISNIKSKLSLDSWKEIVYEQANIANISLQSDGDHDLGQLIIEEAIKIDNSLPLVEYTLKSLYDLSQLEKHDKNVLRIEHFISLGGISGIITKKLEQIIQDINISDEKLNILFSMLINIDNKGVPYSEPVMLKDNVDNIELKVLLEHFYRASIFFRDTVSDGNLVYRLSHENILTSWPRVEQWINDHNDFLVWKRKAYNKFIYWNENNCINGKCLLNDRVDINQALKYIKQGLINDSSLKRFIEKSSRRNFEKKIFILLSLGLLFFVIDSIYLDIDYIPDSVQVNTKTCYTGSSDISNTLEIFVSNKYQADDLESSLCSQKYPNIRKYYNKIKFYWNQPERYSLDRLLSGKLAIIQASESSISVPRILDGTMSLYTPVVRYPDYSSCIYFNKDSDDIKLSHGFFEGKTIALSSKGYSLSQYQMPLLYLANINANPNIVFEVNRTKRFSLLNKHKVNFVADYCPYGEKMTSKMMSMYRFITIEKKLKGTTWYISNKLNPDVYHRLKCIIQEYLGSKAHKLINNPDYGKSSYFANIKLINYEDCNSESIN